MSWSKSLSSGIRRTEWLISVSFLLFLSAFDSAAQTLRVHSPEVGSKPNSVICSSVKECHYALGRRALQSHGARSFEKYDYDLAYSYHQLGAEAVPTLIEFLSDKEPQAWVLAGFILSEQPGIGEQHLSQLVEGAAHQHAGGWLPIAIARIGTPRAVSFIFTLFIQERSLQNQLGVAIRLLGEKAVRPLLTVVDCDGECEESLLSAAVQAFERLGAEAKSGVEGLLSIAKDNTRSIPSRVAAARAIGRIGREAKWADQELILIETQEPEHFAAVVTEALQRIGSELAVPGMLKRLTPDSDHETVMDAIRELAELGPSAKSAGPLIVTYLSSDDWDERLAAARALGYLDYSPAIDALRSSLAIKSDWRLNAVSAWSLSRLHAQAAIPDLEQLAKTHWYLPVRRAAEEALVTIRSKANSDSRTLSRSEFLRQFSRIDTEEPASPRCMMPPGLRSVPTLHFSDGDLSARSDESGASLAFLASGSGTTEQLLMEEVNGLLRRDENVFAFSNQGDSPGEGARVYQLKRSPEKRWIIVPYRELPRISDEQRLLESGDVLIASGVRELRLISRGHEESVTDFAYGVLLHPDGSITRYTCEGSASNLPEITAAKKTR